VLQFRILGPLEVEAETGPVALGGQKQRALLGFLLIRAGQVVSTDQLIDELWGEDPPKAARAGLQNLVAQLRKLLGADFLVTRPPGYVLRVDGDGLDLARFERLVDEARKADPTERAAKLREALALWRGPPLADLAFESFAQNEIRRLEELRLDAVEDRIEADLALGRGAELVAEIEVLVREFPLRERLRGQLMLALYRAGRQAEALEAYHQARGALSDELGIDPSPTLQQLYTSILRQETALEPSSAPPPVEDHVADVVRALFNGRLVAVLGAGVVPADGALPGVEEVAAHLAERFDCPTEHCRDLARVAEWVALVHGVGPLYDELHDLFDRDYEPGPAQRLLAESAGLLAERGAARQLVLTTSFDQTLERAFADAGEELDVVFYLALGGHRGKFVHVEPDGSSKVVELPNAYTDLSLDRRTVLLKIHGQVDRGPQREWESFAVSEDDHIEYLAQAEVATVVPVTLAAALRRSHFLFLGYALRDWSLRVFLHRVWGREKVSYRSWAVVPGADRMERELWRQRGIDLFDLPLDDYIRSLSRRLAEEPAPKALR
jgi:DNA-binding SARP family transcriptional activator